MRSYYEDTLWIVVSCGQPGFARHIHYSSKNGLLPVSSLELQAKWASILLGSMISKELEKNEFMNAI